ncbi:tetraacyldisaccharide 4'-kinase [Aurantibacter crassamenti]|uniref:tetraacyldisaccharide 4'-kinase n=1 Tax=Aurantibacter crassamenti TaxID=1837375 RepID=UPI001939CD6C|nr:tetraacyldisaccharide 4'-kinase [Aurantibacter crassamenti]MBM1108039.1 tetraacyldisaccharide 4'-kinase [Aurantibacter crassamenti]
MILLRIISLPIAFVYGLIIHVRNYFYDTGLFKSKSFETPTICVGNLSLGGTGKTPMVEFLIAALQDDFKVAVLSRGYKRTSKGYVLAESNSTVESLGDEPYQIHKKFKQITLAVDADRKNGIRNLQSEIKPDVIILDDAFQHRKVEPTFSVLLTAFDKLYSEDYFIPFGTLRDGRNQAKRAQIIVVTKCPIDLSEQERNKVVKSLNPNKNQKVLFSHLDYGNILKGGVVDATLESISAINFTLVTGIANPVPLVHYLKEKQLNFEHLSFKDHHAFSTNEIENLNSKEFVLTTEKDFVRLQGKVQKLAYVEITHKFIDGGKALLLGELKNITKLNS